MDIQETEVDRYWELVYKQLNNILSPSEAMELRRYQEENVKKSKLFNHRKVLPWETQNEQE